MPSKALVKFDDLHWADHPMLAGMELVKVNGYSLVRGVFTHGKVEIKRPDGSIAGRFIHPHEVEEIINAD